MIIYIIKKILNFFLIVFLLSLISFTLVYFTTTTAMFGHSNIIDSYFLFYNQIINNQFELYPQSTEPFFTTLKQIVPATFELCLLAIFCSIIIGFPIGILVGLNTSNTLNNIVKLVYLLIYACPIIWVAILIMLGSSPNWTLFINTDNYPTITGLSILDIILTSSIDKYSLLLDEMKYLFLPVLILTIQPCIVTIQLVSQKIAVVAEKNYIKVIKIRENSSLKVLFRHLLPNTIPTVIFQLTYNITILLFSTMVVEIVFDRIGLGTWVFVAFVKQNFNVIAITLLACGILINLLALISEIIVIAIYPMRYRGLYE